MQANGDPALSRPHAAHMVFKSSLVVKSAPDTLPCTSCDSVANHVLLVCTISESCVMFGASSEMHAPQLCITHSKQKTLHAGYVFM